MKPARALLDVAVELRAVAQRLEGGGALSWAALDSLQDRLIAATNGLIAVRDRTPGAPEPAAPGRRHLVAVPSSRDAQRRYYLHGDRNAEGAYYCKRCDTFAAVGHFTEPYHGGEAEHWRRLRVGYLTLRRLVQAGEPVTRPDDAENLFDGPSVPPDAPRGGGRKAA